MEAYGEATVSIAISDCVKHDDAECHREPDRQAGGRDCGRKAPFAGETAEREEAAWCG